MTSPATSTRADAARLRHVEKRDGDGLAPRVDEDKGNAVANERGL